MSKTITIKTVGYMVEKMPDKKAEFQFNIGDKDTVLDCIAALGLSVQDDYTALVEGEFKPLEYCPAENETITLMYLVTGG